MSTLRFMHGARRTGSTQRCRISVRSSIPSARPTNRTEEDVYVVSSVQILSTAGQLLPSAVRSAYDGFGSDAATQTREGQGPRACRSSERDRGGWRGSRGGAGGGR